MLLIVTTENSGIDKYSQEIGKRLEVEVIETKRYFSLREAYSFSKRLRRLNSMVHLPNQHFGRFAFFLKKPFLITVHDLVRCCFSLQNETISERIFLKFDVQGIKKAAHIIAVSQHTKSDLIEYLNIPGERITVIYNGVDHTIFKPTETSSFDKPYILYAGSERPRKNLTSLLKAFAAIRKDFKGLKLVKAGFPGRSDKFRKKTIKEIESLRISGDVIFADHIPEKDLTHYYSGASLFIYPSLYEGFGLPLLEAMACGCPVITSITSALPEVAGDAAITVDPHDIPGLTKAMAEVLTNDELRKTLIGRGLKQAKKFSWEKTTEETLKVYQKVEALSGLGAIL